MADVVEDPHLHSVGALQHLGGETLSGFPFALSATPPAVHRAVPGLGEHNEEVLVGAGFTRSQVRRLHRDGVIADVPAPP
jgi:crotonobetainyl-CoA:carnitine CoA-transferase CaiB-like acyl-CoA transferase